MKNLKFLALLCWAVFFFAGCNKDSAKPDCGCDNPVEDTREIKGLISKNEVYYLAGGAPGVQVEYKICNQASFLQMLASQNIDANANIKIACKAEIKKGYSQGGAIHIKYVPVQILSVNPLQ